MVHSVQRTIYVHRFFLEGGGQNSRRQTACQGIDRWGITIRDFRAINRPRTY